MRKITEVGVFTRYDGKSMVSIARGEKKKFYHPTNHRVAHLAKVVFSRISDGQGHVRPWLTGTVGWLYFNREE